MESYGAVCLRIVIMQEKKGKTNDVPGYPDQEKENWDRDATKGTKSPAHHLTSPITNGVKEEGKVRLRDTCCKA